MAAGYPKRFGKYVLLKPLARGGMGEIYLAAGGETGGFEKLCVIKKVLTEKADLQKANRFVDEAKVVLRLSHANLVTTFDAGEVDGEFYIAMELVEGKDLREIWNRCVRTRTRIPLDVALHVVREVARALAYVHSYGDLKLVHRDVAPPNILLSYFGEVKLTDFGLARSVLKQEHTAPGVVFGRAAYLAPEQARGEVADARTDVYTLGIVLWELLTGQQLLQLAGVDPATALTVVRQPKLQPPSSRAPWITAQLDGVVMRALAVDRNLRYQSAEEMRKALAQVIAEIAPRADAERVSEFLRTLYGETIVEERAEREHLLKDELPKLPRPSLQNVPTVSDDGPGTVRITPAAPGAPIGGAAARRATGQGAVGRAPAPAQTAGLAAQAQAARAAAATGAGKDKDKGVPAGGSFIGRTINGRYRILRAVGEGGMGTVYAGEHVEIGKPVAVKILHPLYSGQQDLVERFRREARAASRIGHPNIVDVTDFGTTDDGCAYFVMEQLEGIDLADVLAHERRVDPYRAVQIAVQICRALQAAHSAGIIHRDLKPENIFLVAREGQADFVKVIDFGIARSVSQDSRRLTNPGIAMGTPEYMAPEQAQGRPADARSDIYAVGAMLYEMVTGVPPHSGGNFVDIMQKKTTEPPRAPSSIRPDIPEELERITLQALERDPDRRPQTMAQLEYALTKSVRGRGKAVAALLGIRDASTVAPLPSAPGQTPRLAPAAGAVQPPAAPPPAASVRRRNTLEAVDRVLSELQREQAASPAVELVIGGSDPMRGSARPLRPLLREDAADHAARASRLAAASAGLPAAGGERSRLSTGRPLVGSAAAQPPPARSNAPLLVALFAVAAAAAALVLTGNLPGVSDADGDRPPPGGAPRVAAPRVSGAPARPAAPAPPRPAAPPPPEAAPSATLAVSAPALVREGRGALAGGRPEAAAASARAALAAAGDDAGAAAEAEALLGDALLASHDFAGAAHAFEQAAAASPRDPRLKKALARARKLARTARNR